MTYDPLNLREPKKQPKTTMQKIVAGAAISALVVTMALVGTWLTEYLQKKSVNYRTEASTEVHKVLGDVYAHLGDSNARVTRAPIGGIIFIHNKYIKTETCHGFTSNVFWDKESHVVHHYSMFTNWFAEGTYEADEIFIIPSYLPPGKYNILKKTVSICNGREHYTINYDIVVEFYDPKKEGTPKVAR